jgi:LPS export ABC transporter protein LptC
LKIFKKHNARFFSYTLAILSILFILTGCEKNIEIIKSLGNFKELPEVSAEDFETLFSDSAKVKAKAVAKVMNLYNTPEKQYYEFPKGILVYQYDSLMEIEATIKADYAIYYNNKKIWEARNDVVAKNLKKNEQLYTEELFWDQNKGIIYSTKFTKIINSDGVFYGDGGFESNQDFTKWHLIGVKGTVNVKESESAQQNP